MSVSGDNERRASRQFDTSAAYSCELLVRLRSVGLRHGDVTAEVPNPSAREAPVYDGED